MQSGQSLAVHTQSILWMQNEGSLDELVNLFLACLFRCTRRAFALPPVSGMDSGVSVSGALGFSKMFKFYVEVCILSDELSCMQTCLIKFVSCCIHM